MLRIPILVRLNRYTETLTYRKIDELHTWYMHIIIVVPGVDW